MNQKLEYGLLATSVMLLFVGIMLVNRISFILGILLFAVFAVIIFKDDDFFKKDNYLDKVFIIGIIISFIIDVIFNDIIPVLSSVMALMFLIVKFLRWLKE